MPLFCQTGASSPPRVRARRRSYTITKYFKIEFKQEANRIAYSLPKRTIPPTPCASTLSIANSSMSMSMVQRMKNMTLDRRWNSIGGPGYGC